MQRPISLRVDLLIPASSYVVERDFKRSGFFVSVCLSIVSQESLYVYLQMAGDRRARTADCAFGDDDPRELF